MTTTKRLAFILILFSLLACSDASDNKSTKNEANTSIQKQWYLSINGHVFAPTKNNAMSQLAQLLEDAHSQFLVTKMPASSKQCDLLNTEEIVSSVASKQLTDDTQNKADEELIAHSETAFKYIIAKDNNQAKRERILLKARQAFILQVTALRQCILSEMHQSMMFDNDENEKYVNSFFELANGRDSFSRGDFSVYEANEDLALLAYSLIYKNQRAFVAFNFSYDNHEMPLPFGFMTSTKVTFWQSDVLLAETFVTSNPLRIRPFTVAIVLVE
jgi:hypothetical protein